MSNPVPKQLSLQRLYNQNMILTLCDLLLHTTEAI